MRAAKSGLVLGFNLGPKKNPQIEILPYLSRRRGPVSGIVFWDPVLGSQTCVELAQILASPVSHSQKIIFVRTLSGTCPASHDIRRVEGVGSA